MSHEFNFGIALAQSGVLTDVRGAVSVLDIGCGRGGVANSLARHPIPYETHIAYVGFDPHPTMVNLGREALHRSDLPNLRWSMEQSFAAVRIPACDRLLVTGSYVLHQHSLTRDDCVMVAEVCQDFHAKGVPVELLFTTAAFPLDDHRLRSPELGKTEWLVGPLGAAGLRVSVRSCLFYPRHYLPTTNGWWVRNEQSAKAQWIHVTVDP